MKRAMTDETCTQSFCLRTNTEDMPSPDWRAVPAIYQALDSSTLSHLALRLLILTCQRPRPIRFIHLGQIDGDMWTIPTELMTGCRWQNDPFRLPLCKEAQFVIETAKPKSRAGFLFPNVRRGVISRAALIRPLNRMGLKGGIRTFRSCFRNWAVQTTGASEDLVQTVIAHEMDAAVTRSSRRADLIELRSILMERWSAHVTSGRAETVRIAR